MTKKEFIKTVPAELQGLKQWVLYKTEKKENGKTDKLPINAITGEFAKSNDPDTWTDFKTALEWSVKRRMGIGFMFAGGYIGVDIDGCRNKETGELTEQARDVLDTLQSYSEASPSGTGVHIICKGKLPPAGRRCGNIEMYEEGRFFTVTGKVLEGYSRNIEERTEALTLIHQKYISKREKPQVIRDRRKDENNLDTSDIIQKASNSRTGYKFRGLFAGNWQGLYPSQSEADEALCSMLAFWCNGDIGMMDNIFRQSGLYRSKWDEKHFGDGTTYGQHTLQEAVRNCREFYIPQGQYHAKKPDSIIVPELDICFMDTVQVKSVDWLPGWKPFFPRGKVVLLEGDPGIGKTTIMCNISAELTRQGHIVVFQSAEDSLEDTVVPRMLAAGADLTKMCCIREPVNTLTFTDERIDKLFEKVKPIMATFDPIQAYFGGDIDMHRANQIRPIMQRLLIMAEKYNTTIVLCMHLNKSSNGKGLYRGLGSIDIAAAARSVILAGVDPQDPTKGGLIHIKSSLAPRAKTKGFIIDEQGFRWSGESDLTEDRVLYGAKGDSIPKTQQAEEFLTKKLSGGNKVDAGELQEEAEKLGIKKSTLWDAKKKLNVQAKKFNFKGPWYWYFNPEDLEEMLLLNKNTNTSGSSEEKTPSNVVEIGTLSKNRTANLRSNSSTDEDPEQIFGGTPDNTAFNQRINNSILFNHSIDGVGGDEECPF